MLERDALGETTCRPVSNFAWIVYCVYTAAGGLGHAHDLVVSCFGFSERCAHRLGSEHQVCFARHCSLLFSKFLIVSR